MKLSIQPLFELLQWSLDIAAYLRARFVCPLLGHKVDSDKRCMTCDYLDSERRRLQ